MGQVSFGTVLREARERKGYDVQSAARRLRIRPDILRALENNDFSRLPARGYTRNMVERLCETGWAQPRRHHAYVSRRCIPLIRLDAPAANPIRRRMFPVVGRFRAATGVAMVVDKVRSAHRAIAKIAPAMVVAHSVPSEVSARARSVCRVAKQQPQREYRESLASRAARAESESRRSNHFGGAVTTQFTNFYSGSQNNAGRGMQARLPYVAVIVIILLLLVIIVALAFRKPRCGLHAGCGEGPHYRRHRHFGGWQRR